MVDRFNNPSQPPRHQPFDDPGYFGFQGGKFSASGQKLAYIKQLGAGAIWLSPVLKKLAIRRWHITTVMEYMIFSEPSRALPTIRRTPMMKLRSLVDAAHDHGLYVVLDIVLNHTGNVFGYQCEPNDSHWPDYGWSRSLPFTAMPNHQMAR